MARLERIYYEHFDASLLRQGVLNWTKSHKRPIRRLPQIFWKDGRGWDEVNLWAHVKATSPEIDLETVDRLMKHLARYASYLETSKLNWQHFPMLKSERVLWQFRGYLIKQRDKGILASSTVTNCMLAVIQFYRFARANELIHTTGPLWVDRTVQIPIHDSIGFERSITVQSSELSIPNKTRVGEQLEDNLMPLRAQHMTELLAYLARNEDEELMHMLSTGFFTGARISTVRTLTEKCLRTAREDPATPGLYRIPVGPGTDVETKFDVSGDLLVPKALLDDLKTYSTSAKRLLRVAKAKKSDQDKLFLTRTGKPYSVATINRLVQDMRKRAVESGLFFMHNFKFHQSRATFGTWLVEILLKAKVHLTDAIEFVRKAMFHKDVAVTLRYIKFYQEGSLKKLAARKFNEAFTGLRNRDWDKYAA
jgi:integrase